MKTKLKAVKLSAKRAVAAATHAVVPLMQIAKQADGNYQSADYFSLP